MLGVLAVLTFPSLLTLQHPPAAHATSARCAPGLCLMALVPLSLLHTLFCVQPAARAP